MNKILFGVIALILVGFGAYYVVHSKTLSAKTDQTAASAQTQIEQDDTMMQKEDQAQTVIGTSVGGHDIVAYQFGTGDKEILFVGGIHGGYEWNTALVGFDLVAYLQQHPEVVPTNETVTVIPVLNPDGLNKVVGTTTAFVASDVNPSQEVQIAGRFNGNEVDLNRNFDCDWKAKGTWQSKTVSGGTSAFSELESQAIRAYVQEHQPVAVVAWYSAAGGVFASNCHGDVLPETTALTKAYATASGYPAHESFDFYATTGDMTNWLAKSGIPAISVLLTNHTDTEWDKNLAGIKAVLQQYSE